LKSKNFKELQNRLSWTVNDILTMHTHILLGSSLDDSLGSAFLDRIKGLINVNRKIIEKNMSDFFKLSIINLCTVNKCLLDFLRNNDNDLVRGYIETNQHPLKKAFDDLEKSPSNLSLLSYLYLNITGNAKILKDDIKIFISEFEKMKKLLLEHYESLRNYEAILIACNLFELKEYDLFDKISGSLEKKLLSKSIDWQVRPFFIRMLIYKLTRFEIKKPLDFEIYPSFDEINLEDVLHKLFTQYSEEKPEIEINSDDIEKLHKFSDAEIRKKLSSILKKSDFIDEFAKRRLDEEASKPHTGYEFSDFEVRISKDTKGGFGNVITVCFPIKSGQEISGSSVPEKYAYQIIKPFTHFYGDCAVIFLTAKKCSQALENYVKKLQSPRKMPIQILQDEELCKLFKYYGCLE